MHFTEMYKEEEEEVNSLTNLVISITVLFYLTYFLVSL